MRSTVPLWHGGLVLLLTALLILGACAARPARAPWCATDPSVGPSRSEKATESRGPGRLMVETARTGIVQGVHPQRFRFFLYSEKGEFLEDHPNDFLSPFELAPGRYVVVSQVAGRYKRVQVIVEPGLTTTVDLLEFERGQDADAP